MRQGVCPFHEETEGSFTVYADTQRFYCFGCGLGGDVLDFIQRTDGVDLPEAIRRLEAYSRIECGAGSVPRHGGGDWSSPAPVQPVAERQASSTRVERDPALLTAAMRFYAAQLQRSAEARRYLVSRGIGLAAAQRLGLGYSPGHGLRERLQALGFSDERLEVSGLFAGHGERFRGMVVIPELVAGRVHWLAGRAIGPNVKPRFQALPGRKPMLGLAQLPAPTPWLVVAEGLFDWLTLASWGLPACAALGTQGMDKLASALQGQPRVFLAFDTDDAGREAAGRLGDLLGYHRTAIVTLPEAVGDVAELASRPGGRSTFLSLLRRAAMSAR